MKHKDREEEMKEKNNKEEEKLHHRKNPLYSDTVEEEGFSEETLSKEECEH
jgi:hypothetical protein